MLARLNSKFNLMIVLLFTSSVLYSQELKITDESTLLFVEQSPSFIGGDKALFKYLADSIHIPESEKKISGAIYLSCIIDTLGKVRNISVLRGIKEAPLTTKEAIRVVSQMPNWKPGRQDGKKVNVKFQIPVRFPLQN